MAEHTSLPDGVELVRTTDQFDEVTHPAGILRAHRVAAGVWGRLVVRSGELGFVFEDTPNDVHRVTPEHPQVIPPARLHHVVIDGPATFVLEFHKEHGVASEALPSRGEESTGLR